MRYIVLAADYINAMKGAGFTDMALEDLIRTKDHGVTAAYMDEMRKPDSWTCRWRISLSGLVALSAVRVDPMLALPSE